MKKLSLKFSLLYFAFIILLGACAGKSIFNPISESTTSPVLAKPIYMAIDTSRNRGYLINSNYTVAYENASLLVLDLSTPSAPSVRNVLRIKNFSGQAYLDTTAQYLYITNRLSTDITDTEDQILRINVNEASASFLNLEEFATSQNPFGIVSDGTNLFTANSSSLDRFLLSNLSQRTKIDYTTLLTNTDASINTVGTAELALSPSGNYIFVTNRGDKLLILNKAAISTPSASLTLGGLASVDYALNNTTSTRGIASDSSHIYVVEGLPPSLYVLNENSLPEVTTNPTAIASSTLAVANIPLAADPNGIALDPTANRAYVALSEDSEIAVIDTTRLVEIQRISLKNNLSTGLSQGLKPFSLSLARFGGVPYLYCMNLDSNTVSIINGNTLSVVATFPN